VAKELSISERLEWLLRTRGVSQNALARVADVSPQTVANTLRHGRLPQAKTIEKFAQTLGVPASVFTQALLTENDLKGIVAKSGPYSFSEGSKGSGPDAAKGGILGLATPGGSSISRPAGMLGSTTPATGGTSPVIKKSTAHTPPAAKKATTAKKATVKKTTSSKTSAARKTTAAKSTSKSKPASRTTAKKTTAAKKPVTAKKATAKKTTAKASTARKTTAAAKKTTAARKPAAAKKATTSRTAAKKPVTAKKTTAKASTRKTTTARKSTAAARKTTTARKTTAAKKPVARKTAKPAARKATTASRNGAKGGIDVQLLITKLQKLGNGKKAVTAADALKAFTSVV